MDIRPKITEILIFRVVVNHVQYNTMMPIQVQFKIQQSTEKLIAGLFLKIKMELRKADA
jgi:hypothetical protein